MLIAAIVFAVAAPPAAGWLTRNRSGFGFLGGWALATLPLIVIFALATVAVPFGITLVSLPVALIARLRPERVKPMEPRRTWRERRQITRAFHAELKHTPDVVTAVKTAP